MKGRLRYKTYNFDFYDADDNLLQTKLAECLNLQEAREYAWQLLANDMIGTSYIEYSVAESYTRYKRSY